MGKKWVIVAAVVFLGVVAWVVATPPKVYSRDEVRSTLRDLDDGWVIESESILYINPHRSPFQAVCHRYLGISGSAVSSGNLYEFENGEKRAALIVYFEDYNVEGISFSESMSSRELIEQIQGKLPGIPCRIESP